MGLLLASLAPAYATVVDCSINDYLDGPYNQAMLQSVIPQHQRFEVTGNTVKSGGMLGVVTQNDGSRLKWRFALSVAKNAGLPATLSYTLIRGNNILIVRLGQGGSAPEGNRYVEPDFEFLFRITKKYNYEVIEINDVRGTCIVQN